MFIMERGGVGGGGGRCYAVLYITMEWCSWGGGACSSERCSQLIIGMLLCSIVCGGAYTPPITFLHAQPLPPTPPIMTTQRPAVCVLYSLCMQSLIITIY